MPKIIPLDPQSEETLRRKLADGSQDPDDYLAFADLFLTASRAGEAISVYRQALALALTPFQRARVSVALAWTLYEMGQRADAISLGQSAIVTYRKKRKMRMFWRVGVAVNRCLLIACGLRRTRMPTLRRQHVWALNAMSE